MLLNAIEVERERGDEEWRRDDEEQRQRHAPEDLERAGAVDASGLRQLGGDRLQRGRVDEEEVREAEPDVDEDAGDLRPLRIEEPRDVEPERLVDRAELVVQQSLPDEHGEERRDRERQDEERALDAPQLERRLVQHDREEQPEREHDEHRERRVRERPDEDADERIAIERIREDGREVLEADVRPPSGLEHLARRRDVRALAVVRVDRSGLDVRERVTGTVVLERRLELDSPGSGPRPG